MERVCSLFRFHSQKKVRLKKSRAVSVSFLSPCCHFQSFRAAGGAQACSPALEGEEVVVPEANRSRKLLSTQPANQKSRLLHVYQGAQSTQPL